MFKRIVLAWLPWLFIVTLFSGLAYVTVQQVYRNLANDPQIQVSEDVANEIAQGAPPQALFSGVGTVDMTKSLSPYVIVYDDTMKPIAGNGILNNDLPIPPEGVFNVAKNYGQNKLTWQPQPDVRQAIVVTYYNASTSGYVLVGRSLQEAEARTQDLTLMVFLAWLVGLVGTFFLSWLQVAYKPKQKKAEVKPEKKEPENPAAV